MIAFFCQDRKEIEERTKKIKVEDPIIDLLVGWMVSARKGKLEKILHEKERKKEKEKKKEKKSCSLLKPPSKHTTKLLNTNPFTLNLTTGLILLIRGHLDDSTLNLPVTNLLDKLHQRLLVAEIQPLLQNLSANLPESLADLDGDTDAHELLEPGHVGDQIRVQIVRVQSRPELGVLGGLEEGGKTGEFLDGFDKVGGLGGGLVFGVGGGEGLGVCGEEGEAEREGRGGEDGESLGEDVGDDLRLEEVRVELVAVQCRMS